MHIFVLTVKASNKAATTPPPSVLHIWAASQSALTGGRHERGGGGGREGLFSAKAPNNCAVMILMKGLMFNKRATLTHANLASPPSTARCALSDSEIQPSQLVSKKWCNAHHTLFIIEVVPGSQPSPQASLAAAWSASPCQNALVIVLHEKTARSWARNPFHEFHVR